MPDHPAVHPWLPCFPGVGCEHLLRLARLTPVEQVRRLGVVWRVPPGAERPRALGGHDCDHAQAQAVWPCHWPAVAAPAREGRVPRTTAYVCDEMRRALGAFRWAHGDAAMRRLFAAALRLQRRELQERFVPGDAAHASRVLAPLRSDDWRCFAGDGGCRWGRGWEYALTQEIIAHGIAAAVRCLPGALEVRGAAIARVTELARSPNNRQWLVPMLRDWHRAGRIPGDAAAILAPRKNEGRNASPFCPRA